MADFLSGVVDLLFTLGEFLWTILSTAFRFVFNVGKVFGVILLGVWGIWMICWVITAFRAARVAAQRHGPWTSMVGSARVTWPKIRNRLVLVALLTATATYAPSLRPFVTVVGIFVLYSLGIPLILAIVWAIGTGFEALRGRRELTDDEEDLEQWLADL